MPLLELREVTMKFGELVANDRVSFAVEEGTIVGLIGPNGAGKTTLFNCISGLLKPTGGQIIFDGKDITGFPPYRIARLGAVRTFQVVRPLKDMPVFENVLVGAYLKCTDRRQAMARAEECIH
ncbi:MAG: ATP-binding cassette domain-containing protein, partial [Syntrophales bacterium]|nr:ATP-binding cassette domain-containing protein [Syntrophales bacterium]